jgi:anti-anti-sigma factor
MGKTDKSLLITPTSGVDAMPTPSHRYISSQTLDGILVVTVNEAQLQGDQLAETMRRELLEVVATAKAANVVIDLRKVKYIASAAFRPFLSLRRELQKTKGKIVLCGLSTVVAETFLQLRLISNNKLYHATFESRPDVAAAVAFLTGKEAKEQ